MKAVALLLLLVATVSALTTTSHVRCIFLHGSGEDVVSDPTTSFDEYWGPVHTRVNGCDSFVFNHDDTVHHRFDDPVLMKRYCGALLSSSASPLNGGSGLETRVVVFTHSMGNLILAAALQHGVCTLDPSTTEWYLLAAPAKGTMACDKLAEICVTDAPNWPSKILEDLADDMQYCTTPNNNDTNVTSFVAAAYDSMRTTDPALTSGALLQTIHRYASGAACGSSVFGLLSEESLPLEALSHWAGMADVPNDGMVPLDSCLAVKPPDSSVDDWSEEPSSRWYEAGVNHADLTSRNGDSLLKHRMQMPLTWIQMRISSLPY